MTVYVVLQTAGQSDLLRVQGHVESGSGEAAIKAHRGPEALPHDEVWHAVPVGNWTTLYGETVKVPRWTAANAPEPAPVAETTGNPDTEEEAA